MFCPSLRSAVGHASVESVARGREGERQTVSNTITVPSNGQKSIGRAAVGCVPGLAHECGHFHILSAYTTVSAGDRHCSSFQTLLLFYPLLDIRTAAFVVPHSISALVDRHTEDKGQRKSTGPEANVWQALDSSASYGTITNQFCPFDPLTEKTVGIGQKSEHFLSQLN